MMRQYYILIATADEISVSQSTSHTNMTHPINNGATLTRRRLEVGWVADPPFIILRKSYPLICYQPHFPNPVHNIPFQHNDENWTNPNPKQIQPNHVSRDCNECN